MVLFRHMVVRESCEPSILHVDDSLVKRAREGAGTRAGLDTVWHAMWLLDCSSMVLNNTENGGRCVNYTDIAHSYSSPPLL